MPIKFPNSPPRGGGQGVGPPRVKILFRNKLSSRFWSMSVKFSLQTIFVCFQQHIKNQLHSNDIYHNICISFNRYILPHDINLSCNIALYSQNDRKVSMKTTVLWFMWSCTLIFYPGNLARKKLYLLRLLCKGASWKKMEITN